MMLITAIILLAAAAGVYVLAPLFTEQGSGLEAELLAETELDRLLSRKAVIYSNLRDLDFEFKMDRLSREDFQRLEAGYKDEAALILQQLDSLGVDESLDETIEKDISARKSKLFSPKPLRRTDGQNCPACGAEIFPGKRYCADCGKKL
jgi:hypothetical protein